jgi:flagellar biosynthesis/type III secretory pathway protein FliH
MKITKLNLGNLVNTQNEQQQILPPAPKNFSYFAKKAVVEEPEFTKTDLNSRVQTSHNEGVEKGYSKGKEEIIQTALALEQNTKIAVDGLVSNLGKFLSEYEGFKKQYMRDMAHVTILAVQKIAAKTIKENSEEIILQALEKSSQVFLKQPEIIFKAKKIILEKIQGKVDNILKAQEFKGKTIFVADETIADGNCVLEWGESGISINGEESMKKIEEIISEYLKSI